MSNISAYTQFTVTLRAYTYWGYGPVTVADVFSPMSGMIFFPLQFAFKFFYGEVKEA